MSLEKNNYIDFHCHSAMKPFGKSFNYKKKGINHLRRNRSSSIWKYNPPSLLDKLVNYIINLTKFSQANFTSLAKSGVSVVCASLYPIEKGFFESKLKPEFIKDIASNFATGVGRKRVNHIQGLQDYFKDLEMEYDFYKQLDGKVITLPEGKYRYKLVKNFTEIEVFNSLSHNSVRTISVIMSIEGLHILNSNINEPPNEVQFMANLKKIKSWDTPPLFVSIAHHFWNHLCGHPESFNDLVKKKVDQSEGLNTGFTDLGVKVLHALLATTNGKRILIDVKHMSITSRKFYYEIIETTPEYKDIPVVVSHGAANGMISFDNQIAGGSSVANTLMQADINLFNEEIIKIAKSKGILGLQLDERRVANESTLKAVKHSAKRSKIMHYRSKLLWNQIQHIAEVLDFEGLFAWDCIVLGTDFDGIIDPLNAFWTAEELPYLADFLERHAFNYLNGNVFNVSGNNISANEIVDRIMSLNGYQFLKNNFK